MSFASDIALVRGQCFCVRSIGIERVEPKGTAATVDFYHFIRTEDRHQWKSIVSGRIRSICRMPYLPLMRRGFRVDELTAPASRSFQAASAAAVRKGGSFPPLEANM